MLSSLKFVRGAVATKDFVPALSHFAIENGTVRGYNGVVALCSPIPLPMTCMPKAEPLIRAIDRCTDSAAISMTAAGRLSIKSGPFRAVVDCLNEDPIHALPEGDVVKINGAAMLAALKAVAPFISDDASRPWSNGVLLKGASAFATNNVIVVEYHTGSKVARDVNLPRAAVKEITRINEAPISAQLAENSMTLHYEGGRWLRTQLLTTQWPDIGKILERESEQQDLPDSLFDALDAIKPFCDKAGRVIFRDGALATHMTDDDGAAHAADGVGAAGVYHADMLALLRGTAQTVDWSAYPKPCIFFGENLRGAISGMRK